MYQRKLKTTILYICLYFFHSMYIGSDQQITITSNTSNHSMRRLVAVTEDATTHGLVTVTVLGGLLNLFDNLGHWGWCWGNVCLDWGGNRCGGNVLVPWCWWCWRCGRNVLLDGSWWCRLWVIIARLGELRNIGQGAGHKGNGKDKEFLSR